jgi:prophage antirepressor-like protein
MGNVVKFEAYGKEYPLSIVERENGKWILAQQVGEAMGVKQIRRLVHELKNLNEIKEGKHCRTVTERRESDNKLSQRVMLSYRGVIRVAMRSQGTRAREFRDWAEEVLYQVMMTGSYGIPEVAESRETLEEAMKDCVRRGFALSEALKDLAHDTVAKIIHFRRLGLTQRETGAALGMDRCKVQQIEKTLRGIGIVFEGVKVNKRDKEIRERLIDNLIPEAVARVTGGHEARPYGVNGGHVARPYGVTGDRAKDLSPLRIGGGAAL